MSSPIDVISGLLYNGKSRDQASTLIGLMFRGSERLVGNRIDG